MLARKNCPASLPQLAKNAAAIDGNGAALGGGEKRRVVCGVILEVGILYENQIARALCDSTLNRSALSQVWHLFQHPNIGKLGRDFIGAIGGPIVDDDDLLFKAYAFEINCSDRLKERSNGPLLVEGRYHDGQFWHRFGSCNGKGPKAP